MVLGAQVAAAHGGDRVESLTLSDGRRLPCEHVVVGIGVDPDLAWIAGSGLDAAGVQVDGDGRTDAPGVFAAGDAAATYDPVLRRHVPGGHWESASRQGAAAARAMLGLDVARPGDASFWSDLYDTRVQYLGHARLADETVIDGDPATRDFSVTFTRAGAPVAVLLVGRPHELPRAGAARRLTERDTMPYLATIDAGACAAHGDCEAIAPEIFAIEDVAVVVGTGPDELVLEAARICPAGAIVVTDANSGARSIRDGPSAARRTWTSRSTGPPRAGEAGAGGT